MTRVTTFERRNADKNGERLMSRSLIPSIGPLEYRVLYEIERAGTSAYAAQINRELSVHLKRVINIGQMSMTMATLIKKGYVEQVGTSRVRRGQPRKILRLTPFGVALLCVCHKRTNGDV